MTSACRGVRNASFFNSGGSSWEAAADRWDFCLLAWLGHLRQTWTIENWPDSQVDSIQSAICSNEVTVKKKICYFHLELIKAGTSNAEVNDWLAIRTKILLNNDRSVLTPAWLEDCVRGLTWLWKTGWLGSKSNLAVGFWGFECQ